MCKEKHKSKKILLDKTQLREELSEIQYRITQQGETEPPFSNDSFSKELGIFLCICCRKELFASETKFESGTGWPSFYQAIDQSAVELIPDHSHMMIRTEVKCAQCSAHLGHVFEDGPPPTNLRFCINGSALKFKKG